MVVSHWTYLNEVVHEVPEGAVGFVYLICDTVTGKKYIGRKTFTKTRRVAKKGLKRKKVVVTESNWKKYTGSNEIINELIAEYGHDRFTYEILAFGYSTGQVNYLEENLQHKFDVVLDENFYNNSIGSRRFMSMTKSPELFVALQRLKSIM